MKDSTPAKLKRKNARASKRVYKHVNNFIRVQVHLRDGTEFPLTLDINQSFDYVARLIEAECTFRAIQRIDFGKSENSLQNTETGASSQDVSMDMASDVSKAFDCHQLYDAAHIAISFASIVKDILKFDDEIFPVTLLEDSAPKLRIAGGSDLNVAVDSAQEESKKNLPDLPHQVSHDDDEESKESASRAMSSELQASCKPSKAKLNDENRASLGRNPLPSDQSIASKSSSLDDHLYLILHNLSSLHFFNEFCLNDYSIENVLFWIEAEVFRTIPDETDRQVFAHHIYHAYIKEGAPLALNLDREIRQLVITKYEKNEKNMFGDLQDFILFLMRQSAYTRFEESAIFQKFLQFKTEDRYTYVQSKILWDYSLLKKNFKKISLQPDQENLPLFRQKVLLDIFERYFAKSLLISNKYFDIDDRREKIQKSRQIRKQKRLIKFFGFRPSEEQLRYQNDNSQQNLLSPEYTMITPLDPTTEDEESLDFLPLNADQKRKKVGKLVDFFGDPLPSKEMRRQSLPHGIPSLPANNSIVRQDTNTVIVGSLNKLSSEERIVLQKKAKKLLAILGTDSEGKALFHNQVVNRKYNSINHSHLGVTDEIDHSSQEDEIASNGSENEDGINEKSSTKRKKAEKLVGFFGMSDQLMQVMGGGQLGPDHASSSKQANSKNHSDDGNQIEDEFLGGINERSPEEKLILQRRAKKLLAILGDELDGKPIFTNDIVKENQKNVSLQRITSTESLYASDDDYESDNGDESNHKSNRLKLDKLRKVMGAKINESHLKTEELTLSRPLSPLEKRKYKKKNDKLQRVFGNIIPAEQVINYNNQEEIENDIDDANDIIELPNSNDGSKKNSEDEKQNQMIRLRKLKKMLGITEGDFLDEEALRMIHEAIKKEVENEEDRKSIIEELQKISLSPFEKKLLQKKNQKLEQLFGAAVPANIINCASIIAQIESQNSQTDLSIAPESQMDDDRRMRLARLRKVTKMLGIRDVSGSITEEAIRAIQEAITSLAENEDDRVSLLEELVKSKMLL